MHLDDKLVLMGMSCVGKTTFASSLASLGYKHHSFDAQYKYKLTGLPGVSRKKQWQDILRRCTESKFVLDNWSTEDTLGNTIYEVHPDACLLILFDNYSDILSRYRVPVRGEDGHRMMYDKMYCRMPFDQYKKVKFVKVGTEYELWDRERFQEFVSSQDEPRNLEFNREKWIWE